MLTLKEEVERGQENLEVADRRQMLLPVLMNQERPLWMPTALDSRWCSIREAVRNL
jgi:hypothetical protein